MEGERDDLRNCAPKQLPHLSESWLLAQQEADMRSLAQALIVIGVVIFANEKDYGIEFVLILCAAVALYMLWVSRLRAEVLMYLGGMPNSLGYWIFVGAPLGLVGRTLALAAVLVPIYVLAP